MLGPMMRETKLKITTAGMKVSIGIGKFVECVVCVFNGCGKVTYLNPTAAAKIKEVHIITPTNN